MQHVLGGQFFFTFNKAELYTKLQQTEQLQKWHVLADTFLYTNNIKWQPTALLPKYYILTVKFLFTYNKVEPYTTTKQTELLRSSIFVYLQ